MKPISIISPIGEGGDARRDAALNLLRVRRAVLVRRIQRTYLRHLIDNGPDTSDAMRALVPIPPGIDPRVVGAAVRALSADFGLITSTSRAKSRRRESHARALDVWTIRERSAAVAWLPAHPELPDAEPGDNDLADPFAI